MHRPSGPGHRILFQLLTVAGEVPQEVNQIVFAAHDERYRREHTLIFRKVEGRDEFRPVFREQNRSRMTGNGASL